MKNQGVLAVTLGICLLVSGLTVASTNGAAADTTSPEARVLAHYAAMAHAIYEDSLVAGQALADAVDRLIATPSQQTLKEARDAWLASRVPYQQSEVYRFGNAVVDDWEGKVNAWPLDEGLIDYVDAGYGASSEDNPGYGANVIANAVFMFSGEEIDASMIDAALLADTLHELGGVEANVATGYHAIEFLLWGQDLNGTGPGAGARPHTDFDTANCTGGHCERRAAYLKAAADLLVDDLAWMTAQWAPDGPATMNLTGGDMSEGLAAIITGMGSLSYGELAGERMKLGLLLHDPEEEHDCFSDNTHRSHYDDALGIRNIYLGEYMRIDGTMVSGPGLSGLVAAVAQDADMELRERLDATMAVMGAMVAAAEGGEAYDQMIGENNASGNALVQAAIDALTAQTDAITQAAVVLELTALEFEGSDSLDDPEAVFQ